VPKNALLYDPGDSDADLDVPPDATNSAQPTAASRNHRPLHVVIVDEELPYPPTSGKRIRTLNLTLRLARRHRIAYVCHRNADPAEARESAAFSSRTALRFARPIGRRRRSRGRPFTPGWPPTCCRRCRIRPRRTTAGRSGGRCASTPRPTPSIYGTGEWTPYVQAVRGLPAGRRLVVAHNVESVIWRRYFENETHPLRRWYVGRQWRKFERFERRVMGEVDRAVAVSGLDAERLRRDFGARRVDVVENGVDPAYFRPRAIRREPDRLLSSAASTGGPTSTARVCCWSASPGGTGGRVVGPVCLVGRNPPDWLRRQAAAPGVELHADVPDVRPYLSGCGLMVVPLRIGGGSRLKILEALARIRRSSPRASAPRVWSWNRIDI